MQNSKNTTFAFQEVTDTEVLDIIKGLKAKKSAGHDNISNNLIKSVLVDIYTEITFVINYCLQNEYFPSMWKVSRVTPLFKKGDRTNITNYRPISLLPCISKILEKVVDKQVRTYMSVHGYFADDQYGFRAGHQCAHAVARVVSILEKARRNKEVSCAIFCDLRKAFDTISHSTLYDILSYYGINTNFFKSYLTNRLQFVQINDKKSKKMRINYSVPQGSILGPLLFSIYINLLPTAVDMHTNLYADDTVFILSDKNIHKLQEKANLQLHKAAEWFNSNTLTLAPEKTVYILHNAKKNQSVNIKMGGCTLSRVKSTKYVGFYIDERLDWKNHINYIARKTRQNIFSVIRSEPFFPPKLKLWLYNSLFKPYLEYCCPLWGH